MSGINYSTMAEALSDVPDPHNARAQSHEWRYLFLVIAAAMLSGEKTLKGIGHCMMISQQRLPSCRPKGAVKRLSGNTRPPP